MEHKSTKHQRERVHPCNVCDMAFHYLPTLKQHKSRQHRRILFVCNGCGKKLETNNKINRHTKFVCGKPCHRKNFSNSSKWGKGQVVSDREGGEEEDGAGHHKEEARYP